MPDPRQVVAFLQSFLESGSETPTEEVRDFAQEYATLCAQVNERLAKCDMYLSQNMRSEAIHLAETNPPVMDAAAVLEFKGAAAWREFSLRNGLPPPAPVSADTIARLNDAYVQEGSLSALMTEYRRVVRTGETRQKVALLRRLMFLDKGNPHWRTDLAAHEQLLHAEMSDYVARASAGDDVAEMERLIGELGDPQWLTAPPPALTERLRSRIRKVREVRARQRGEKIVKGVSAAYGAFDFDRVAAGLRSWQLLVAANEFTPSEELTRQISEAREWHDGEVRKKEAEAEFQADLADLQSALDRQAPKGELENAVQRVNKSNREIPPALRTRAERALSDARLAESREFRLKMIAVAVLIAVVVIPVVFFVYQAMRDKERQAWLNRIEAARGACDYDAVEHLLLEIRNQHPSLYASPQIQDIVAKVRQESDAHLEKRRLFDDAMRQLHEVSKAGFPPERSTMQIEDRAAQLAFSNEEKLRLEQWRAAKADHEATLRRQAEADCRNRMASVVENLKELAKLDPRRDRERFEQTVKQANADLGLCRTSDKVSEPLKAQCAVLQSQVDSHAQTLSKALDREAAAAQSLAAISRAMPDLRAVEALVAQFLQKFPEHEEVPRLQALLRDCRSGMSLCDGPMWNPTSGRAPVEAFLSSEQRRAGVWGETMGWVDRRCAAAEPKYREVEDSVLGATSGWMVSDLYSVVTEHRDTHAKTRYYYREWRGWDGGLANYEITVFNNGHNTEKVKLNPDREIFKAGLGKADDDLAAHCRVVRKIKDEVRSASVFTLESALLRGASAVRRDADSHPVIRIVLMRFLLTEARKITVDNAEAIDRLLKTLDVDASFFWMDYKPDSALVHAMPGLQGALERVGDVDDLSARDTYTARLYAEFLSQRIECVGYVDQQDQRMMPHLSGGCREAWVLLPDGGGKPQLHVATVPGADGKPALLADLRSKAYVGQPLFARVDRATADGLLASALGERRHDAALLKTLQWPSLWPVNGRSAR